MTRRLPEGPRLSEEWRRLVEQGEAPGFAGRTAEEMERNTRRRRPIMPTERRRRKRRLSLTVSEELVAELRRICREYGYAGDDGEGMIASPILEELLWLAVGAYRDGMIERYQEQVVTTVERLRWKS